MEDSLEDFIRINRNVKNAEPKVKISQEVLLTIQKKRECEKHALKIVEFLIDGKLRPEAFLHCLKYVNQEHYQDVVEERALGRLCGYALCGRKIPEMPKQKYIISTRANKIYEITDRKNYCSNFCYKASLHIKDQIETSPLWLRNFSRSPDFELLPATETGAPGEEVEQGIAKPVVEPSAFTSVSHFAEFSLNEVGEVEATDGKFTTKRSQSKSEDPSMDVIPEDEETEYDDEYYNRKVKEELDDDRDASDEDDEEAEAVKKSKPSISSDKGSETIRGTSAKKAGEIKNNEGKVATRVNTNDSAESKKHDKDAERLAHLRNKLKQNQARQSKLIEAPTLKHGKATVKVDAERDKPKSEKERACDSADCKEAYTRVKRCVKEWLTVETYVYIYGEDKIKRILNEKKLTEYFDKLKIAELQTTQQLKYMAICKRLKLQEMAEEKFDGVLLGKTLRPLPDYKLLKEESKELDLKVKSFYSGSLHGPSYPVKPVEENGEKGPPAVLPMVDAASQNALRRKVLLDAIHRTLQNLIRELNLSGQGAWSGVHDLVRTFKLEAHNVVFVPATWTLIAVVLLNMLSLRDAEIKTQLEHERSVEYVRLILSKFPDVDKFMTDLLCIVEDVDSCIEFYIGRSDE